ncbi:putative reverse transcriptase domain-containing protein [Tanacetum coccineum]
MAISVISVSLDSSEESVRTPAGRVILFGTIPTTIPDATPTISPPTTHIDTTMTPIEIPTVLPTVPPSPDHTPALPDITLASPNYSPASDTKSDPFEDPSSDHIPPLPAISPFLSLADNTTDNDTPDTLPSPTHGTHFTEIISSTQRSPVVPHRQVMILVPGQPIPYRRPYRYHLNGPLHMLTARKRMIQLEILLQIHHQRHRQIFHSDASSDSSSRHSLPDHSSPDLPSTYAGPSRKRRRSPMTSVHTLSPVSGALSPVRADLIPSPKRIRDFDYLADVEVDSRESSEPSRSRGTDVGVDDDIERVDESCSEPEIDHVYATIEACFDFADIIKSRGIDVRVVAETVARDEIRTDTRDIVEGGDDRVTHPVMSDDVQEAAQEERAAEGTYETLGSLVQRFHDHTISILVHRVQVIEGVQREQGRRIVGVESAVTSLTKRIAELERDNRGLRGTASVEGQRVDRLQRGMPCMQRELRQIRRLRFNDRVRVGRLEAKIPNTRSVASMTHEEIEDLVTHRVAEEMEAREAAMNLEPLNESGDEQEGGNGNGGRNRNGNRNGNHGMNYRGFMSVARECKFKDFLKCKPHNFSGTKGVVRLTRWFKKMEIVFSISNCPSKYQLKYATCTLQDSALTWWNSHKRTIGVDAAYDMNWAGLMKLMTEVYCPRNEIQKMENELWNLTVKGNDLTAYTERFQEFLMKRTMERFIGGLPDNIQGNVIAANLARLEDAIRIANQLMDKKLQGYAARSAENKRRMESNPRDNH